MQKKGTEYSEWCREREYSPRTEVITPVTQSHSPNTENKIMGKVLLWQRRTLVDPENIHVRKKQSQPGRRCQPQPRKQNEGYYGQAFRGWVIQKTHTVQSLIITRRCLNYKIGCVWRGLCNSVTQSSQCGPGKWRAERPGVNVEQRHMVSKTPNSHCPDSKWSCPGKRVRASEIPITLQHWLFCLLFCLNSLPVALHLPGSQHPTDENQKFHMCLGMSTDATSPKSVRHRAVCLNIQLPSASQCITEARRTELRGQKLLPLRRFANPPRYQNWLLAGQHC